MSNKFEISEQYWVVSEVKASLIEVYNNFLKAQDNFVRSLKGIIDPTQAKAEYISALYGFYTLSLNGFPTHLEELKINKKTDFGEDDYFDLSHEDKQDNVKLLKMGYELQKWASTKGAFRITHQEKNYKDPIEMMLDENEMS